YDDNLKCDIESDLREIEFLLFQGEDSDLKDSIDQTDLTNLDDLFVDPTPEMFTDEQPPDYSFPPRFDVDDDLPPPDTDDKVFNPEILIHEKSVKIITRVAQEKKLTISFASLVFEDFDPPFYELLVFKDVSNSMRLLPFLSENEEKVFKPGIYTFEKVHFCFLLELSHPGERIPKKDKIGSKLDKNGKQLIFHLRHGESFLHRERRLEHEQEGISYDSIPNRLDKEYHTIKDDTLLVNMYTTREVKVRGMQIPNDLLTDGIKDTQAYKDYVDEYEGDDDDEDNDDDDDDHNAQSLIRTQRTGSSEIKTEQMQTPILSPPRSIRTDLSSDKAIIEELTLVISATNDRTKDNLSRLVTNAVKKEKESSQADVPALISQEFHAHALKIIKELLRYHMHNIVLNVPPTTIVDSDLWNALKAKYEKSSASTDSCRYDAFRKRDHDDHPGNDARPEGEKSAKRLKTSRSSKSASGSSSKQPAKESSTPTFEQEQQQDFNAWVDILVIDEDEVIPEDETPELLNEFQNVNKRVPSICDHERMKATNEDMLSNQFRDAEEYAYHLEQAKNYMENQVVWESRQEDLSRLEQDALLFYGSHSNPNEPPRYLYNKDLFFLKNGNTEEKKYVLSLHKIHETSFSEEDLEEKTIQTFNEEARKEEKMIMDLVDISKFCYATLEKVLKEVKLKIFETEFKTNTSLLGELDLKIMKAYEREIMKRLKQHM
nr:hypothetical protein [Tanacetum cinerariifolium]